MIRRWVALWDRREPATVLAVLRISLGALLFGEFAGLWAYDLLPDLFTTVEHGGLSVADRATHPPWWFTIVGPGPESATLLALGLVAASLGTLLGLATPVSIATLLLLYAQSARILPLGDRAIDMLLRNALLILLFSRCGATWSLDARIRTGRWSHPVSVPAWPRYLIVLQLVVVYFTAGASKFSSSWWPWGEFKALYLILNDPSYARMDVAWLDGSPFFALTQLGTALTVFFQVTYPVILPHYFPRSDTPGAVQRTLEQYSLHWAWIGIGGAFHIGIAVTLSLGIFPWGMLALYPAYLHPTELTSLLARARRCRDGTW